MTPITQYPEYAIGNEYPILDIQEDFNWVDEVQNFAQRTAATQNAAAAVFTPAEPTGLEIDREAAATLLRFFPQPLEFQPSFNALAAAQPSEPDAAAIAEQQPRKVSKRKTSQETQEQREKREKRSAYIKQRWDNMPEAQKTEYRAARAAAERTRRANMTPEQRAKLQAYYTEYHAKRREKKSASFKEPL